MYRLQRELFRGVEPKLTGTLRLQLRQRIQTCRAMLRREEPLPRLEDTEFEVFSQNGDDGIILFLLAVVGWNKVYSFVGCNSSGVYAFFIGEAVAPAVPPPLPLAEGFREYTAQNRIIPHARQFAAIQHLDFVSV